MAECARAAIISRIMQLFQRYLCKIIVYGLYLSSDVTNGDLITARTLEPPLSVIYNAAVIAGDVSTGMDSI